jgi:hypothetical protein
MLALVAESHLFGIKIWIVGRIRLTSLNRRQDYISATARVARLTHGITVYQYHSVCLATCFQTHVKRMNTINIALLFSLYEETPSDKT